MEMKPIRNILFNLSKKYNLDLELVTHFAFVFGLEKTKKILDSLKIPSKNVYLLVNKNKIQTKGKYKSKRITPQRVKKQFIDMGINLQEMQGWEDVLVYEVEKDEYLPEHPKNVVVNWGAVKHVMLGGDVNARVIKEHDGFGINERVSIRDPEGNLIAEGLTVLDSDSISKVNKVIIRNSRSKYVIPRFTSFKIYQRGGYVILKHHHVIVSRLIEKLKPKSILIHAKHSLEIIPAIKVVSPSTRVDVILTSRSEAKEVRSELRRLELLKNVNILVGKPLTILKKEKFGYKHDLVLIEPHNSRVGNRPLLQSRVREKDLLHFSQTQEHVISSAATHVKPGGYLIYFVSSFLPVETRIHEESTRVMKYLEVSRDLPLDDEFLKAFFTSNKMSYINDPSEDPHDGAHVCVYEPIE